MHACAVATVALAVCPAVLAASPSLQFLDFGPSAQGYWAHWPVLVNDRGDIAFTHRSETGAALSQIRWADGAIETVSITHEAPYNGFGRPWVYGLSDSGEALVLYDARHEDDSRRRLYRYERGGTHTLAADVGHVSLSNASGGPSGHGAFVGAYGPNNENGLYLLGADNTVISLGRPLDASATPFGVNRLGQAAGDLILENGNGAFRTSLTGAIEVLSSLGDVTGGDINDAGAVTGHTLFFDGEMGEGSDVWVWRDGEADAEVIERPERYAGARAFEINNDGWIAGDLVEIIPTSPRVTVLYHGMVYTPGNGYINLNDFFAEELQGAFLSTALAMSDSGLIVGEAVLANGHSGLYIVTIPAPASSLPLAALGLLAARRRRMS